jgi:hypothetical protein
LLLNDTKILRKEVTMKIICPTCLTPKEITGYHRDDPILECGHVKTLEKVSTRVMIEEAILYVMQKENVDYAEACRRLA